MGVLCGRDAELQRVRDLLQAGSTAIRVVGAPGSGRTSVLDAVAADLGGDAAILDLEKHAWLIAAEGYGG